MSALPTYTIHESNHYDLEQQLDDNKAVYASGSSRIIIETKRVSGRDKYTLVQADVNNNPVGPVKRIVFFGGEVEVIG